MAQDQTLTCQDCGAQFVFTQRDQEFYTERGFSPPRRCKNCRDARKAGGDRGDRGGGMSAGSRGERQMYEVPCSSCGKTARVPFKPTTGKPVYCSDCYQPRR